MSLTKDLTGEKYANALYSNLVFLKYPTYFSSFCPAVMKIIVYMLMTPFFLPSSHSIILGDKTFPLSPVPYCFKQRSLSMLLL